VHAISELSQLLFPSRCFGCRKLGPTICSACRSSWHPHYYRSKFDGLTVHSALIYTPTASKIILAAKESGLKGADELIINALVHALDKSKIDPALSRLVPVPSSKSSHTTAVRGELILVDDVVTTGATLREALRAVNSQGFHAIGSVSAVTACVAQPLR